MSTALNNEALRQNVVLCQYWKSVRNLPIQITRKKENLPYNVVLNQTDKQISIFTQFLLQNLS